jgi:hypothetical protein
MRTAPFLLAASLLAACIKPIPVPCVDATDCDAAAGGACIAAAGAAWCAYADPSCSGSLQRYASDVGDALAGTCVPLVESCEPGEFQACAGDQLTRCNATGTATETILCELGCSEALAGCRLCEASTTACTNGTVATCDADGRPTATRECPLGCFADEPRCREIVPSNGLGAFLAEAETGPDIVLSDGDRINSAGIVNDMRGLPTGLVIPAHRLPAPDGGVPVVVFTVRTISIGANELLPGESEGPESQVPAVAVVAAGDITIRGVLNLSGSSSPGPGQAFGQSRPPPGSITRDVPCVGRRAAETSGASPGSGGGGNVTVGATGGRAYGGTPGSGGAATNVTPTLVPLRGGCAGGYFDEYGGYGGGAVQLVSATRVVVLPGAAINAGGGGGSIALGPGGGGGGGSGGAILLEAPTVELRDGSGLAANGGGGGGANANPGTTGRVSLQPAPGGVGCRNDDRACSAGGAGAARDTLPEPGVEAQPASGTSTLSQAGGGGGAIGVIRINTLDGSFQTGAGVILSPAPTTGPLRTR